MSLTKKNTKRSRDFKLKQKSSKQIVDIKVLQTFSDHFSPKKKYF